MKNKTLKSILLSFVAFLWMTPAFSQAMGGPKYETPEDSIACGKHLSAYRTFFKNRSLRICHGHLAESIQ
jgi:hypothetical protein